MKPAYLDTWYNREKLFALLKSKGLHHVIDILEKYFGATVESTTPASENAVEILNGIEPPF